MTSLATTVERSDLLRADIADHPGRYRVLTGERPTGPLHLGHYFGTVAERVRLHNLGVDTFIILRPPIPSDANRPWVECTGRW